MSALWTSTKPKARQVHTCDDCNRVIEPGETYRSSKGLSDDGDFVVWKDCAHCLALLRVAPIVDWCYAEGYGPDDFHEFEPRDEQQAIWHAQWKAGWRDEAGALHPVPAPAQGEAP